MCEEGLLIQVGFPYSGGIRIGEGVSFARSFISCYSKCTNKKGHQDGKALWQRLRTELLSHFPWPPSLSFPQLLLASLLF